MQLISVISLLLIVAGAAQAAVNGRCMVGSIPGVCLSTNACKNGGGTSHKNYCPSDPPDIQCCTKTSCGKGGNCKWTNQCAGTSPPNLCPGPASFKCCEGPFTKCKSSVVKSAKAIQAKFQSDIQKARCETQPHDANGFGLGYSFSVKLRAVAGSTIAQWVMQNHSNLKVKRVCWGAKTWDLETDKSVKPWAAWTDMGETGSDTSHCRDHVGVQFLA